MTRKKNTSNNKSNGTPLEASAVYSDPSIREQMVADAAYFRAEKRGFHPMNDLADWFEAEEEIDRHLISLSE